MLLLLLGQFRTILGKFGQNWASFYFNIGSYWAHNVKITVNFLNSNIVVIEFSISFRAPHIHWEVSDTNFKLDEFFRFFWQLNSSMFISSNIFYLLQMGEYFLSPSRVRETASALKFGAKARVRRSSCVKRSHISPGDNGVVDW